MAKAKKELLEEAKALGIEVDYKTTVAEIQTLMAEARKSAPAKKAVEEKPAIEETAALETVDQASKQDTKTDEEEPSAEITGTTAKAGKRSSKALKEAAEKQAKEERKASGEIAAAKPKKPVKPARSRLERKGKHFRNSAEQIEAGKAYSLAEAAELAKKTSHVKFDASVELHVNLNVDPRQADQNIRDNLVLPAGSGKQVKIAVLTEDAAAAKQAGADIAGTDELYSQFDKGQMSFDVLIATPNLMPQLGKYARSLGPKGLMPNPKSGTVTNDIAKAIKEAKAGRVEYRVDSTGIIHLSIGKVSFEATQLQQNLQAVLDSIKANKPSSLKGTYFKSAYVATSMGPSIKLDTASLV